MKTTSRIIPGMAADLIIEEVKAIDPRGGLLWYVATIYVRERGKVERRLVRKSRLPETAAAMGAAIQRNDIRALRRIAGTADDFGFYFSRWHRSDQNV